MKTPGIGFCFESFDFDRAGFSKTQIGLLLSWCNMSIGFYCPVSYPRRMRGKGGVCR